MCILFFSLPRCLLLSPSISVSPACIPVAYCVVSHCFFPLLFPGIHCPCFQARTLPCATPILLSLLLCLVSSSPPSPLPLSQWSGAPPNHRRWSPHMANIGHIRPPWTIQPEPPPPIPGQHPRLIAVGSSKLGEWKLRAPLP
jgi:hypothetical protein